jgi:D-sedoheptulose 7-phosphate isomerase
MKDKLTKILNDSIEVKRKAFAENVDAIEAAVNAIVKAFHDGKKLLICGNGGSAADSQHIAAEFIGRFQKERRALPAIALTTDTSVLTALGNDYGVDVIFSRQVEALGQSGDLLWAISTSGRSSNVLKAVEAAKAKGMTVMTMTGRDGGPLLKAGDIRIHVASSVTARVQEAHIALSHAICELVEEKF